MDFNTALSQLPSASAKRIALRINAPAERALRQGHPWVFDQSITEQSHAGAPGDLAVIFDAQRRFLAIGLYDPMSAIRVRILQSRDSAVINTNWFQNKLTVATLIRAGLKKKTPPAIGSSMARTTACPAWWATQWDDFSRLFGALLALP